MLTHALGTLLGGLIAHYLFSPIGLIAAVALLVAGISYVFPAFALKWFTDARVWLAIVCVCGVAYIVHLRADVSDLKAAQTTDEQTIKTQGDALKTLQDLATAKATNAAQTTKLRHVASSAPLGHRQDAVLDQIAADDAANAAQPTPTAPASSGPHGSGLDSVLDVFGRSHGVHTDPGSAHDVR